MTPHSADHSAETKSFQLPADAPIDAGLQVNPIENATDEAVFGIFRKLEGYEYQYDSQRKKILLGAGSFGVVYQAFECELKRPVAIKMLKSRHRTNRRMVTQFFQEGVLTSRLQHPGIPPVHAMGLWDGCPVIVMKFVVGKTLKVYLNESKCLISSSNARVIDYFMQVCRAVAYAHAQNTLHLDLKPGNVMIGAQDEIQVMDWGLGRPADDAGDSEGFAGTLPYMPPEQANGRVREIGPQSDVFSLGAMLTEILTGSPPYVAPSKDDTKAKDELIAMAQKANLDDAFQRLNKLEIADPALAPLTGLARWCLSEQREMRPRDASIVAEALAEYQEGLRLQVQQEIADRARREQQVIVDRVRFRARVMSLGIAAILLLIGSAGAVWSYATVQSRNAGFRSDLARIDELICVGTDTSFDKARRDFSIVVSRAADGLVLQDVLQTMKVAKADLDFVLQRNEARQGFAEFTNGLELNSGTALEYGTLFQKYGIAVENIDEAAELIRRSRIQSELLAGLDHWALVSDDFQKPMLWQLAMEASNEGWCREFRTRKNRENSEELKLLVARIPWGQLSANEFEAAARGLIQAGLRSESREVLRKAVERFPQDFWLNLLLGQEIAAAKVEGDSRVAHQRNALEAISYLRAALAIDENAHVYSEIARVSLAAEDPDTAELAANQALKLDKTSISAQFYRAQILLLRNKPREAASIVRQAIEMVKTQSPVQQSQWLRRLNELLPQ